MDDTQKTARLTVVTGRGDMDMDTLGPLAEALQTAARTHDVVVLDASQISFGDSSFLNLLLNTHKITTLRVAAPQKQLLSLLEITGADGVLTMASTVEAALAMP
ncbi:STAS domain-containing protein [Streptomyces sp. NPDC006529]|uniref:STAS domain-containing protein n=1 Tax=Streptomyces sp. NPDC006529 TaxID=3157177 RepID=UPI0033BABBFA